jgi:lipopolysaccharide export system protein LptC
LTSRAERQVGRSDGDRVFRAAARHSRFVRFLRRAIPAGIIAVAGILFVAAFFQPFRLIAAFPIDPGKVSLSGTKIVMELPRLSGFTHDARPYELTARAAAQDVMRPDLLELKDISAHVELEGGERVELKSASGLYDTKAEILKLADRIVMTSSTGYEARLSEATLNVGSGHIVSESPVGVKLLNGWLNAKRLEILDSGDLIVFGGGVEMTLNVETPPSPASTPAASGSRQALAP